MSNARGGDEQHDQRQQLGHLVADVGDDLVVDPAPELDGVHQRAEVVVGEDHPRGLLGHLAAAAHRDADVRLLERGGVVDGVAGRRDDQALSLHQPGQAQLVLGGDAAEDVQLGQAAHDLLVGHAPGTRLPLIAPGPSPSIAPIAPAVIGLSPVIMRTSIPALERRRHGVLGLGAQRVDHPHHADEGEVVRQRHRIGGHRRPARRRRPAGRRTRARAGPPRPCAVGGLEVGATSARSAPAPR